MSREVFPGGSDCKESAYKFGRPGFDLWVGKIPWRRRSRQPTPVFLPGESLWTKKPSWLQSMGLQRVGHDWATKNMGAERVLKNWCFPTVVLEKTHESPLDSKKIKSVNPKGKQPWIFIGRSDTKAEAPILCPPDVKSQLIGKDPDAGKD